jgi:acyl carrier protein
MSLTSTEVREQLAKLGMLPAGKTIADSESLIDSGIIDSLRLMELVSHIEQRYGVTVDDEDLIPENFDSIDAIVSYLTARTVVGHA